jgi:hypothetical protein
MVKPFSEIRERFSLSKLDQGLLNTGSWPGADDLSLPKDEQDLFVRRANAVKAYIKNDVATLVNTALSPQEALRLLRRCLTTHPDGRIYGFRALLPHIRVKKYTRISKVDPSLFETNGYSGAFLSLLENHTVLKDLIEREVFKKFKKKEVYESRVSVRNLHKKFLEKCKELGLEIKNEYPFNTHKLAYNALAEYVNKIQLENPKLAIAANQSLGASKTFVTSDGSERPVKEAFQRVECDAHHIDAMFCILIPSQFGELIPKVVKRLWVIIIEELQSRAILGYQLSLRRECNSSDILEAIKSALTKWQPRQLVIPELKYNDGAGFPSSYSSRYCGVLWQEFSTDQALANISDRVKSKLSLISSGYTEPLVVNRHIPNDRPFIERFFKTLETNGFHRLPSTTGSGIDDPSKSNPEILACKYFIQLEHLEDLMDVLLANYNAIPHSSIGYRNPLQYLDFLTAKQDLVYADPVELEKILSIREKVTVKGGLKTGRRPFVHYCYATYSSDALKRAYQLCGKKIIFEVNPKDARIARAYTEDGAELGILKAAPPWNLTPHTLEARRTISNLRERKLIYYSQNDDPIITYLRYIEGLLAKKKCKHPPTAYLELRSIFAQQNPEDLVPYVQEGKFEESPTSEIEDYSTESGLGDELGFQSPLPPPKKAVFRSTK